MQIKYSFNSLVDGPRLLILGSIHGNERCGSIGINNIVEMIKSGDLVIKNGSVICMPYANWGAYIENKRYIDYNLNRIFNDTTTFSQEHLLTNEIKKEIDLCDFVLDLHSFSAGSIPFIFNDFNTEKLNSILRNLSIKYVITGWVNLYENNVAMDTIGYAKSKGKIGVTIECGQHIDNNSGKIAEITILETLTGLHMVDGDIKKLNEQIWIHLVEKRNRSDKEEFSKDWQNFDVMNKGDLIMIADGDRITAPYDGYVILPNKNAKIGDEWIYFGKPTNS